MKLQNGESKMTIPEGYTQPFTRPDPNAKLHPEPLKPYDDRAWALKWHLDARGGLAELFRESWDLSMLASSEERGSIPCRQAYISATSPGVVKAWHLHKEQTDRFVLMRGRLLVAMCGHGETKVNNYVLDADKSPVLLQVPPMTAHGWYALGNKEAWVLNLCSHEYDGTDEFRRPPHEGPWPGVTYDWRTNRDG
jgi:dTDP-4-dehydrorhamnose 3,5-epimerase